jgi:hypothetical protein
MPLHLFDGRLTSITPPFGSQRRRTSPGMSENSRKRSTGCQTGPSVNTQPVATWTAGASSSTNSSNSGRRDTWLIASASSQRQCGSPTSRSRASAIRGPGAASVSLRRVADNARMLDQSALPEKRATFSRDRAAAGHSVIPVQAESSSGRGSDARLPRRIRISARPASSLGRNSG